VAGRLPAATAYVERYEHRYGSPPVGYSDTLPYDAVTVLVAAWRKGGERAAEAVVPVLERGTFAGVAACTVSTPPTRHSGDRCRGVAGNLRAVGT